MRTGVTLLIAVLAWSQAMANEPINIVGKWVKWNPRTVIGTGQTDTVLDISGQPGAYRLTYTTGGITRIRDADGRFVLKTTTATFSPIPIKTEQNFFLFTLPEEGRTIRLKLTIVGDQRALITEEADARPFLRMKDNKASEATSDSAQSAPSEAPQG
jgi:hypothetical protein